MGRFNEWMLPTPVAVPRTIICDGVMMDKIALHMSTATIVLPKGAFPHRPEVNLVEEVEVSTREKTRKIISFLHTPS